MRQPKDVIINGISLETILEEHKQWLENPKKGKRADLSGAQLSEIDLSGVNLTKCYLSRADLRRTSLSGTNLTEADLSDAYLFRADLSRSELSRASLVDADLSEANLCGANLSGADLSKACLLQADLRCIRSLMAFYLGNHFGYAWKRGRTIIVKIAHEEHSLNYWLDNLQSSGIVREYSKEEIAVYKDMLKLIKKYFSKPKTAPRAYAKNS